MRMNKSKFKNANIYKDTDQLYFDKEKDKN